MYIQVYWNYEKWALRFIIYLFIVVKLFLQKLRSLVIRSHALLSMEEAVFLAVRPAAGVYNCVMNGIKMEESCKVIFIEPWWFVLWP